jgi:hypothetical protein
MANTDSGLFENRVTFLNLRSFLKIMNRLAEQRSQNKVENEEIAKRKNECRDLLAMTEARLVAAATLRQMKPNRVFLLDLQKELVGRLGNQITPPDRLALRYRDALLCWFCKHPIWSEHVFPVELKIIPIPGKESCEVDSPKPAPAFTQPPDATTTTGAKHTFFPSDDGYDWTSVRPEELDTDSPTEPLED